MQNTHDVEDLGKNVKVSGIFILIIIDNIRYENILIDWVKYVLTMNVTCFFFLFVMWLLENYLCGYLVWLPLYFHWTALGS